MNNEKKAIVNEVPHFELPRGYFCGGNCSDCIYYDRSERNGNRYWCCKRESWYSPNERNGCFDYRKDYSRTLY